MIKYLRKIRWIVSSIIGYDVYDTPDVELDTKTYGNDGADRTLYTKLLNKNSIVYSYGIGKDITFDLGLIKDIGCTIYGFDPTIESHEWLSSHTIPSNFKPYARGVSGETKLTTFYTPVNKSYISHSELKSENVSNQGYEVELKTVGDTMKSFSHSYIDCIKFDVEGSEYSSIRRMFTDNIFPGQVLVEVHHRFDSISIDETKELNQLMRENNYKLFALSSNGQEYSRIKASLI